MSQVSEIEIAAKAVAPRVTKAQIDALMAKTTVRFDQPAGSTSTFAHVYMGQFYLASGHSACVDPANFDAELGMRIAQSNGLKKAEDQLWQMEGYVLFKQLNQPETTHVERMVLEQNVLQERMGRLQTFMGSDLYLSLDVEEQELQNTQLQGMALYNQALLSRIMRSKPLL